MTVVCSCLCASPRAISPQVCSVCVCNKPQPKALAWFVCHSHVQVISMAQCLCMQGACAGSLAAAGVSQSCCCAVKSVQQGHQLRGCRNGLSPWAGNLPVSQTLTYVGRSVGGAVSDMALALVSFASRHSLQQSRCRSKAGRQSP